MQLGKIMFDQGSNSYCQMTFLVITIDHPGKRLASRSRVWSRMFPWQFCKAVWVLNTCFLQASMLIQFNLTNNHGKHIQYGTKHNNKWKSLKDLHSCKKSFQSISSAVIILNILLHVYSYTKNCFEG